MGQRGDHGAAQPTEERAKRWVAAQIATQRNRVDEVADDLLERRLGPAGGGATDDDVVLAGVSLQQDLECREQDREERRPLAGRQRPERFHQRRVEGEGV